MAESTLNISINDLTGDNATAGSGSSQYEEVMQRLAQNLEVLNSNIQKSNDFFINSQKEDQAKGNSGRQANAINDQRLAETIGLMMAYKGGNALGSGLYSSMTTSFLGNQGLKTATEALNQFSTATLDAVTAVASWLGGPLAAGITYAGGSVIKGAFDAVTGNAMDKSQQRYFLGLNHAFSNTGAGIQSRSDTVMKAGEQASILQGFGAFSQAYLGNAGKSAIYESAYGNQVSDQSLSAYSAGVAQLNNFMPSLQTTLASINNMASNNGLKGDDLVNAVAAAVTLMQVGGISNWQSAQKIAAGSKYLGGNFSQEAMNYETSPYLKKLQAEMIGKLAGVDMGQYFAGNSGEIAKVNALFKQNQGVLANYYQTNNLSHLSLPGLLLSQTGFLTGNEHYQGRMPLENQHSILPTTGKIKQSWIDSVENLFPSVMSSLGEMTVGTRAGLLNAFSIMTGHGRDSHWLQERQDHSANHSGTNAPDPRMAVMQAQLLAAANQLGGINKNTADMAKLMAQLKPILHGLNH